MRNIRRLFFPVLVIASFFIGCSGSDEATEDDYLTETDSEDTTLVTEPGTSPSRRFNVQADTLTAHPRKKNSKGSSSVVMRTAAAQKYYSVQIGAYKLKSNADRNYAVCKKRFKQPIIKFFEPGISMERLCVGHFPTAKAAKEFAKSIQEQYPNDYKEAWVTVLNHE